jgi:hypothetical protein
MEPETQARMNFDQTLRRAGRTLRARIAGLRAEFASAKASRAEAAADSVPGVTAEPRPRKQLRPAIWAILVGLGALILVYPLWAWWVSTIDDDANFAPPAGSVRANESMTVASMAALLDREVNVHGWTPNDPFFVPTGLLANMPNFQRGIEAALGHFALVLKDQLGHVPNSPDADGDLQQAADMLQYPSNVWIWAPTISLWPTSSEEQYRKAIEALRAYNSRLAAGQAAFGRGDENLRAAVELIRVDLTAISALIDEHVHERSGLFLGTGAGSIFYLMKGQLYGDYIVLKALAADFAPVIEARGLEKDWAAMTAALKEGAELRPSIVLDGTPNSQFVPCHLCTQGFLLLRARDRLHDIADKLR